MANNILVGAAVVAGIALVPLVSYQLRPADTCTFADGTTVPGTCIFDDEFTGSPSFSTNWFAIDDWAGPILDLVPENGCISSANATEAGGNLILSMTAHSRSSCPQTWAPDPYYNTHSGGNWPTGQPTTFDTSWIQSKLVFTYGFVTARVFMPGGLGPGGDITLSGVDCLGAGQGTINAAFNGPLWTNSAGACNFPQSGEIDITEFSKANGVIDSAVYVGATPGSPPFLGTLFTPPVNYYGALWSNTGGVGGPYVGAPISDPSLGWHIVSVDWRPNSIAWYVDGSLVAINAASPPTWIPAMPMFIYIFNQDTTTVTLGTLPQSMLVDYIHISCPRGVPCVVSQTP